MISLISVTIGCVISFFLGVFLGWFVKSRNAQKIHILLEKSHEEKSNLENKCSELREKHLIAEKKISALETKESQYQSLHTQFTDRFKNISQEIINAKSQQFQKQIEKDTNVLLNPLRDKIKTFQQKVEETYDKESRERFSLKDQIEKLCNVHGQLSHETKTLTQALKGNVKTQGQWGEMILETILQNSGLSENEHYILQGKGLNLTNEQGKKQKPDVVIKLPDQKQLIIDSKVSLTHYEKFTASSSEEEKNQFLQMFLSSLRSHIMNLSKKEYHQSDSLNTLDLTLLFFPIEGALSLALQKDRDLFAYSWRKSIAIVSPTSLLATLKVVESIWRRDKQNRHALEIATAGGKLYDKFVSFTEDLMDVGNNIKKADASYHQAFKKLKDGQGNIVSKLEKMKELGARASKQIPTPLLSE